MTIFDKRKRKLCNDLKDKEFRDIFVEESINVGISFQIRKLRKDRKFTQKKIGEMAGMKQERISLLENPNYSRLSIEVLKRLASAFDVGLLIKFVPFSTLVKHELGLNSESLSAKSFNEDIYFQKALEVDANDLSKESYYAEAMEAGTLNVPKESIGCDLPETVQITEQRNYTQLTPTLRV